MTKSGSLYASPMLYDILYTPGTAAEVDALERIEKRFVGPELADDRLWLEPACGTGRYLRVAAGRGRTVAGFDRDQSQIDYAQSRLSGQLFQADMLDFTNTFQIQAAIKFAFNPVNSIRHLQSDLEFVQHLNQMARALAPGGLYVVGLSLVDYGNAIAEEDIWRGARGRCQVTQLVNYLPPEGHSRSETVISHLTVTRPSGVHHFDATYDLHCCNKNEWREVIEKSDMEWVATCDTQGHASDETMPAYQLEVLRA
ncbi:MAG: SAM-dependent methyltransferase [Candidatus Krumholzibacteriia bacterium]|jgi:SAM-dependent methyltransferase